MRAEEGPAYPWQRPLGARPTGAGATEFRVWAPEAERVSVNLRGDEVPLSDAGFGIWEGEAEAQPGEDYRFVLDGGRPLPDPATRWQPKGLRGPSRVFAPRPPSVPSPGMPSLQELVIYELHVGTFSPEGTFTGAIPYLEELARLGVRAIELMPVAEFPGARGWGYDGVYLCAAQSSYGGPEGLQELIDAAHGLGLAVILDVVYNHVGASGGKALESFGPYFTAKYETPWGKAMNYDDELSDPVREWVLQSAEGWVRDFGIDGLRLDAIHAIYDSSAEHIVEAVARRVHAVRADALVIAESGLNDPRVVRGVEKPDDVRPARLGEAGRRAGGARTGWGCDGVWADDFHHALRTLLTDDRDGYYEEFGRVAQLAKALHRPHVHDGTYSSFRKRCFGAPADDVAPERFIVFAQNHDQVGNRAFGDRLAPAARPLAAFCTLLSPFTPLLFMGEEYGERAPFQFFSDHIDQQIAEATRTGRRAEFAAFASFGHEVPDPQAPETFAASKLTRERDPALAELYAKLLSIRSGLPVGEADVIAYDEADRWIRVRRGPFELVCNFNHDPDRSLQLDVGAEEAAEPELALATDAGATLSARRLSLPPLTGALLRDAAV